MTDTPKDSPASRDEAPMYACGECSRTFDGPLAANAHEDATGHAPIMLCDERGEPL